MSTEPDAPLEPDEGDLIRLLAERGYVTEAEVEQAVEARLREERRDVYRPLVDYLVDARAVTPGQVARARQELADPNVVGDLPGFRLLETLGKGSMGTVHRGLQLCLQRVVAIKLLSRRLGRNRHYVESFARECRLAARVGGFYFPQVFDAGYARGQHYLVMEFVAGTSVGLRLSEGLLGIDECLHVAVEVCGALEQLHALQIVHRDVKPQNIVLADNGRLKLLDLGLARQLHDETQTENERGAAIGTPHYISPEQIVGSRSLDGRSDLYSLGSSLYHMLTGRRLFERESTAEVFAAHMKAVPQPPRELRPEIPFELNRIVLRLLAKSPDERPASAAALKAELERLRRTYLPPQAILPAVPAAVEDHGLPVLHGGGEDESSSISSSLSVATSAMLDGGAIEMLPHANGTAARIAAEEEDEPTGETGRLEDTSTRLPEEEPASSPAMLPPPPPDEPPLP